MKIIYYCQHVLGIGHFFRSLEICRALEGHRVVLVTGGEAVDAAVPGHVELVRLPGLMMDEGFTGLRPAAGDLPLDQIRERRRLALMGLITTEVPDAFLVELYPFGRKAFAFELDPVLEALRRRDRPPCTVVCSLRDILVEKADPQAYEARVVDRLNRYFDALLVHADPTLVRLEETFRRTGDIEVPVVYTGFVAARARPGSRERVRSALALAPGQSLIVVSAGGGAVGAALLESAILSWNHLRARRNVRMQVFTGPYLADDVFTRLAALANENVRVARFTDDFPAYLCAADLSVSMGGYNTTMAVLAARVPALIHPFGQNREQGMRAQRLQQRGIATVIGQKDLQPVVLAVHIERVLDNPVVPDTGVALDGAAFTAAWLKSARFG